MQRAVVVSLAMLAGLIAPPAQALVIVHSDSFVGTAPTVPAGVPEFDPALGTLDTVAVQLNLALSIGYTLPPLGAIATPRLDFDAVDAPRGFAMTGSGVEVIFGPVANPSSTTPLVGAFTTPLTLSFTLDAASDLAGGKLPSAAAPGAAGVIPAFVEATRADFIRGPAPIGITEVFSVQAQGFAPTSFSIGGVMIVTYDYTPHATPVPIPASAALLAAPLTLLAARRRRR